MIAETWFQEKNYEKARNEYLKVKYIYKFPEWQAPALFQAGLCDEVLGNIAKARETYSQVKAVYPESEFAKKESKPSKPISSTVKWTSPVPCTA